MADLPPELRDRYGLDRSPASKIGYVLVVLAVLLGAVIIASQLIGRSTTIELQNIGHKAVSDSEVHLTYSVHGKEGLELECYATAVNDIFAEIGARTWTWTMEADSVTKEMTLATSERAAAGHVEYCVPLD